MIGVRGGMELSAVETAGEGLFLAEEVEGEAASEAEVGGGVAGACAGLVLLEDDVEDPVALVLGWPSGRGRPGRTGRHRAAGC